MLSLFSFLPPMTVLLTFCFPLLGPFTIIYKNTQKLKNTSYEEKHKSREGGREKKKKANDTETQREREEHTYTTISSPIKEE